jgi:hypothetical protein
VIPPQPQTAVGSDVSDFVLSGAEVLFSGIVSSVEVSPLWVKAFPRYSASKNIDFLRLLVAFAARLQENRNISGTVKDIVRSEKDSHSA